MLKGKEKHRTQSELQTDDFDRTDKLYMHFVKQSNLNCSLNNCHLCFLEEEACVEVDFFPFFGSALAFFAGRVLEELCLRFVVENFLV